MNTERFTTVTYTLENGSKIVQPINKECFVNQKGNKISEVMKSQKLRNDLPNTVISTAPHDSEQKIPITMQTPVSIQAPFERLICSSS